MRKRLIVLLFLVIFLFFGRKHISALECEQESDVSNKIKCLENVTKNLGQEVNTLSSQIQYLDSQISLTSLRIQQTEKTIQKTQAEIELITTKIEGLDTSLNYLSKQLISRIVDGYKKRSVSIFNVVLDSDNASELFSQIKYLKNAQDNNQKILVQVQSTKSNFEEQKKIREEKKKQLDELMITLASQKQELNTQQATKQRLLADTKNSEQIYQQLLQQAQAEYAAIQGIISGGGTETVIRDVSKGETIASMIPSASCNSSGGHLHFMVKDNDNVNNPFNYLKPVDIDNCSGSSCGSGDGDSVNLSGGWDWPLNPKIEVYQGYGSTWAVQHTWVGQIYSFHNGIDIRGSSYDVKSVADGTLYKGGYYGSGGCVLPYVMLKHKDSNIYTYYLHVYPQ